MRLLPVLLAMHFETHNPQRPGISTLIAYAFLHSFSSFTAHLVSAPCVSSVGGTVLLVASDAALLLVFVAVLVFVPASFETVLRKHMSNTEEFK
jgi:hypothetical protein